MITTRDRVRLTVATARRAVRRIRGIWTRPAEIPGTTEVAEIEIDPEAPPGAVMRIAEPAVAPGSRILEHTHCDDGAGACGACDAESDAHELRPLAMFFDARARWSERTFGPGNRYLGVVEHIRRELREIEASPADLEEWIDVVLLAMDGAWRSTNANGADFVHALAAKAEKNRRRTWPAPGTVDPAGVTEHVRETVPEFYAKFRALFARDALDVIEAVDADDPNEGDAVIVPDPYAAPPEPAIEVAVDPEPREEECEACGGRGLVKFREVSDGPVDTMQCPQCFGTGASS